MTYGYARVSTKGQAKYGNSLESQSLLLTEAGADKFFYDSFTGRKMERPEFNKLLSVLHEGDKLIVTKLDRFARSAVQGSQMIEELIAKGVTVHVLNIGLMDNTPTGKLIRNIMLSFAEFERDIPAVYDILKQGCEKAREAAVETMDEVRRAMKLNYFEDAALISSQSERFGTK